MNSKPVKSRPAEKSWPANRPGGSAGSRPEPRLGGKPAAKTTRPTDKASAGGMYGRFQEAPPAARTTAQPASRPAPAPAFAEALRAVTADIKALKGEAAQKDAEIKALQKRLTQLEARQKAQEKAFRTPPPLAEPPPAEQPKARKSMGNC